MSLDIIPADPEIISRMYQSGQPIVLYQCQLQGNSCGLHVEGTTSAMSAHLRIFHSIAGQDSTSAICTWGDCSKTLKKGSMARHLLTHLGVKVRCSTCGVVMCRHDLLRTHIKSSEPCYLAIADAVHGPEGRSFAPIGWAASQQGYQDPCGVLLLEEGYTVQIPV
ncbi:hypothetical protein DEU56DRAFT_779136, partial [Suillus clintonianus]|uniref:uncharacterized protein n=1 Tax=Suillus clintonianus TaxID=1904413 RepID=UPI001B864475